MLTAGCSQEHLELKKKIIYNNLNFFYLFTLNQKKKKKEYLQAKLGTPLNKK